MKREIAEKNGSRLGFTLIELLVVVSIIALLMAMLMPALNRARQAARKTACAVNQRSMYTGMVYYEEKYGRMPFTREYFGYNALGATCEDPTRGDGRVPESGWWYTEVTCSFYGPRYPNNYQKEGDSLSGDNGLRIFWPQHVGALIDNSHQAMACPASTVGKPWDTGNPDQRYGGHFGISSGQLMSGDKAIKPASQFTSYAEYERPNDEAQGSMRLDDVKMASSVGLFWDQGNYEISHGNAACPQGFKRYLPGYRNNLPQHPSFDDPGGLVLNEGTWQPSCSPRGDGMETWVIEIEFQKDAFKGRHPNKKINIMYADGHVSDMMADSFVDGRGETVDAQERARELIWGLTQGDM